MTKKTNLSANSIIAVFLLGMASIADGRTIYVDSYGAAGLKLKGGADMQLSLFWFFTRIRASFLRDMYAININTFQEDYYDDV